MTEQTASKVPQIRFKGFADEWNTLALGDLGKVATNKRVFIHQTTSIGDVPFYKIGTFGREPKLFISQSLFDTYKERFPYPEKSDLLISVIGSIGRIVEYTGKDEYFQDSNIVWLQHNGAVVNAFLKQFYSFVKWSGLEGSTIKHLYNKNILETQIDLPCQKEQTKIGEYFRELDSLIGLHQRKHDKLVTLKKAMLQKMFPQPGATTPEIRFKGFSGEWVKKTLGQIANVYQPQTISQRDLTATGFDVYGANGIIGKYSKYNHKESQIAVTCRGNTCGTVNFTKEKSWITGNAMVVNIDENALINKQFLFQQLSSQDLNYLITGSGQPQITGAIKLHEMWICHPAAQQKIGTYFRTLDSLISKHATQLQKLQQLKSACLEKMFV